MSLSLFSRIVHAINTPQSVRYMRNKHRDPKWKRMRGEKVIKIDLSRFESQNEDPDNLSHSQRRQKMKERGIFPQKPWLEKPMYISCTSAIFEPYIPPEGDGKFSAISTTGAKQNMEFLMKKTKSYQAYRKIKKYEEEFNASDFPEQALEIYKTAHQLLAEKDKEGIQQYITEKLYPQMYCNMENKQIQWKFIKSLEPARIVHARCTTMLTDTNVFAQVTCRFHTQQSLVMYDRFGRLVSGSPVLTKDVLDYIVFEKHLSNQYGVWRMHAKIIPTWMTSQISLPKTFAFQSEETALDNKADSLN
ncbi:hypothetical protein TKK_0018250 [Trichogramma kaykai]|uniref:Large ribosomal subunit protein mL45 n=1 Tax=Trichogramma kaykai TaxID=54128 RepID=A0ABD2VYZ7_9HYME